MQTVKVRKVGNSLGMVLPKEAVARMNVREDRNILRELAKR